MNEFFNQIKLAEARLTIAADQLKRAGTAEFVACLKAAEVEFQAASKALEDLRNKMNADPTK